MNHIDEYIARFPKRTRQILQRIREIVRSVAPDADEAIKYRIPTFVLGENLVHFAGFENHVGFYPTPSAIEAFGAELEGFERAKGSVRFPLGKPVPFDLIERMVEFRVREVRAKARLGKRKG